MAANSKRTPFNPAGPFLARKNFDLFDTKLEVGKTYPAAAFERLHERRVELLFDSGYIDMGDPAAKQAKVTTGARPLDRDGDGNEGGSLSQPETAALNEAGISVEDWLKLPEPERTTALADALSRAGGSAPLSPDAAGGAGGGAGDNGGAGGVIDTKIAYYQHAGFGRWFAHNAAGEKIGDKMSKAEAEGAAKAAGVEAKGLIS